MATIIVEGLEILPASQSIAIFGLGFVGTRLVDRLEKTGRAITGFSRNHGRLLDASRWHAADQAAIEDRRIDVAVVTMPPQNLADGFWTWLNDNVPRRILLGTTSIYQRDQATITEDTPLRHDHNRYAVETRLLAEGWQIIRLSGLYAADRNPVGWIARGRIGYDARQVNLVHGDDVARALNHVIDDPGTSAVFNLADGQQHRWCDIIDHLQALGVLTTIPEPSQQPKPDTTVDPSLFTQTYPDVLFRNFWQALDSELVPAFCKEQ